MPGRWSDTPTGMSADLRVRCEALCWEQAPCRVDGARLCTGGAGGRDQMAVDSGCFKAGEMVVGSLAAGCSLVEKEKQVA